MDNDFWNMRKLFEIAILGRSGYRENAVSSQVILD
jgi:hypothetical protein